VCSVVDIVEFVEVPCVGVPQLEIIGVPSYFEVLFVGMLFARVLFVGVSFTELPHIGARFFWGAILRVPFVGVPLAGVSFARVPFIASC
jgi:hypothetical protein